MKHKKIYFNDIWYYCECVKKGKKWRELRVGLSFFVFLMDLFIYMLFDIFLFCTLALWMYVFLVFRYKIWRNLFMISWVIYCKIIVWALHICTENTKTSKNTKQVKISLKTNTTTIVPIIIDKPNPLTPNTLKLHPPHPLYLHSPLIAKLLLCIQIHATINIITSIGKIGITIIIMINIDIEYFPIYLDGVNRVLEIHEACF